MGEDTFDSQLKNAAQSLLQKRLDRLISRKVIFFPWLRYRMLMHKRAVMARLMK